MIMLVSLLLGVALAVWINRRRAARLRLASGGGLTAQGLVLGVQTTVFGSGNRIQRRISSVQLDVEPPGRPPYVATLVSPIIPSFVDLAPGVTVDVAIDRNDPQKLAIVGPSGAAQWLPVAAQIAPNLATSIARQQTSASAGGCGIYVLVIVLSLVAGTFVQSFFAGSSSSESSGGTEESPNNAEPAPKKSTHGDEAKKPR